ncbi:MAG TPA: hypothetical protein VNR11_01215 [Xanthobacteraceae bacterium]|nr:hypothetical protein [Xanthobacteraceae bacterium]
MPRLIATVLCLLALLVPASAQPLTAAQFTQEFAKYVGEALPSARVKVNKDLDIDIALPNGGENHRFLDNAYKAYLQDPENLRDVLADYSKDLIKPVAASGSVRDRIVPMIKDRGWVDQMRGMGFTPATEKFAEDLFVAYALHSEDRIRYLSAEELRLLKLDTDELHRLAHKNLLRVLPKIELVQMPPLPIMAIMAGDDYVPSLLLTDIWTQGQIKVEGDIVVAIPARASLWITGSRSRSGVAALRKIAREEMEKSPHPLTDTLYVYRKGKFKRFGKKPKTTARSGSASDASHRQR